MKIKILKVIKVPGSKLKSNWRNAMQVVYVEGSKKGYIDKLPKDGGATWIKYKGKLITNIYTTYSAGYNWLQTNGTPLVVESEADDESNRKEQLYIVEDILKASNGDLTNEEIHQLANYIWLFFKYKYQEHWEVNEYISNEGIWDEFDKLRSLNDHGEKIGVEGIEPRFFAIVCKVLSIEADNGNPITGWIKY